VSLVERVARNIVWIWRLCKGWLPQAFGTAATVLSIIWGGYGDNIWSDGRWALVSAVVLATASLLSQFLLQRPSYMELSRLEEVANSQSTEKSRALEQAFTVLIRKLAEHCSINANSDRISVYYFHDEGFVMLARWSSHPTYTRAGRGSYPTGQGAIGEAWDRGSAVSILPPTRIRWEKSLEAHHGFPPGSTQGLSMHCQSIAAIRIDADHHAVGVLVFESADGTRASQSTLDTAKSSMLFATLSELVNAVATLTPRVEKITQDAAQRSTTAPNWKPVRQGL